MGSIPPLTTISQAHKVGMTGPVILGRAGRPPLTLSLWASRPLVSPPALVSSTPANRPTGQRINRSTNAPILDTLNSILSLIHRPLVQRSEQRAHNPPDAGSNPAGPTTLNKMNNPTDPADASPPAPQSQPPADDKAWLSALLFPDGSALIDYGDGTLIVDPPTPYGKG